MIVAIHQPNYLPWLGYFAKIAQVDVFVFLDDVQFSKGSYTNRVQIARNGAPAWLTEPVSVSFGEPVSAVRLANEDFVRAHRESLKQAYREAAYFEQVFAELSGWLQGPGHLLSPFNRRLVEALAGRLGLCTRFLCSSELGVPAGEADWRLAEMVHRLTPGGCYLSGNGGDKYQTAETFRQRGIGLHYSRFKPLPYARGGQDFIAGLSILDALFHLGWDGTTDLIRTAQA